MIDIVPLIERLSSSPTMRMAIGIFGLPYSGKRTLAAQLKQRLEEAGFPAEIVNVDETCYMELVPGVPVRRTDFLRDIEEFHDRSPVAFGEARLGPTVRVLLLTATYKYIVLDMDAYSALDFRIAITFRNAKTRLDRKLAAETDQSDDGRRSRSEAEVVGEFSAEQLQEWHAADLIQKADIVWMQDTNEIGRFRV